jgi:hypothetical protein
MQRPNHRAALIILSSGFLAFMLLTAPDVRAAQSGKPLTQPEVLQLLQGGVPSSRVTEIVDDRGIDFEFTQEIEQEVRDAGGGDDVVAALRRASQRRASSDQPQTGGLIIKTTPGQAQIYLNDEPKGVTSTEGEIRFPALRPGSYKLRVSLLGYQSYEKLVTITAGEDQNVDVTLVQNSPASPAKEDPVPPQEPPSATTPSTGIPIPGIKPPNVQFFEGPYNSTLDRSKRVYRYSFDRFRARTIYWELDLTFPPPGQRIDFPIDAVWRRSDESEMTRQNLPAHVEATWGSSWHTLGYGYSEPGHWTPGTYRVDFYYGNTKVASGTFQIN